MAADEIAKMALLKEEPTNMELDMEFKSALTLKKSQHLQSRAQIAG